MKNLSIDEIKEIGLEILKLFHEFCEANDLKYYLAYGTLLGAVRHKGFIPWDDDIDVYMPRYDYEKFLKIFDKKNNDKTFKTISIYNDKTYWREFARIVNTKTVLLNKTIAHLWIDIFPLDNMSDDYKKAIFLRTKVKIFNHLRSHKVGDFSVSSNPFINIIHKMLHMLMFCFSLSFIVLKIDMLSKKYMSEKMTKYVGHVADSKVEIYESVWFKEKILLDFEEYKFWGPKEYNKILTQYFGDYMKLPPENERVNHSIEAYWKD